MFQDSVPAGSYNDPFLSSVCVCVCVCVCVFIAKETIVLTQWGAGPGLRRESQNIALVLFLFFWGGVDIPRINFSDPSGSWIVSLHEFS